MQRRPEALDGPCDLLVIGGGITGAGVALDAALRGLRVVLVDKGDFASGTSSISSKLVHGGLRYLEQGHLGLVYEALRERRRLLHNAPHLVWPLRFTIPFYRGSRVPPWQWRAGLLLYDVLAGRGNLDRSRTRTTAWVRRHVPTLDPSGLVGAGQYMDAQMDDARLVIAVLRSAAQHGAVVCNYAEAVAFADGGVRVRDTVGGTEHHVTPRVVVNAAGPWSDGVRRLAGEDAGPLLAPTKGVHVVARDPGLASAFLLLHPRDGRVFFVLPWLGKMLLGTTDTDCESPDAAHVTDDDIHYLLEGYNRYFTPALAAADVLGSFVGVRPLARTLPGDPSARSREWRLHTGTSGLLSVVGGKYTTYRHMAERITDAVLRRLNRAAPCRTRAFRLDGALADAVTAVDTLRRLYGVTDAAARHLVGRYGSNAGGVAALTLRDPALAQPVVEGEPDLRAEAAYQRDHEMAVRDADVLLRRTRLGLFHPRLLTRPSL